MRMKRWLLITLIVSLPAAAGMSSIDALVRKLAGDDELARAQARQLLPRASIEAVPKVLPLISDPNPVVWCAAYNVLADFANQVTVPGRQAERIKVTDWLMTLLAPEQPFEIKERGLRLLPCVVPNGYKLKPIAALLKDPELREKARAALQEIGTPEARAALRNALGKADPEFQCALLHALRAVHDKRSLGTARKLARHREPTVRAAAALALSWTGDPAYVKDLQDVMARADAETCFDAADALVRLADAMIRQGGDRTAALAVYQGVLQQAPLPASRGAALVGMIRYGNETGVADILAALQGAGGKELEPVALAACENVDARANPVMLAVYKNASAEMRLSLIRIFGGKQDPAFLDILKEAATDSDATLRRAAWTALADSQLSAALPSLVSASSAGSGEDRTCAIAELKRLAQAFRNRGEKQPAGEAFLALHRVADSEELRGYALEGIAQFPTSESSEIVIKAVEAGQLGDKSAQALAGLAKALLESGRTEQANRAVGLLIARATSAEAVKEIVDVSRAAGGIPDLARQLGFVTTWTLVGPFPWSPSDGFQKSNIREPNVDPTAVYFVNGKEITWKPFTAQNDMGLVDLGAVLGPQSNATAYGMARILVPADIEAVARMGSDDGVKLWVNGEVVHEHDVNRGTAIDQDQAPVKLKTGSNVFLIQITQGGGGWNFCLRLTKPDGAPLAFTNG
jgi:HEAT repeat protein